MGNLSEAQGSIESKTQGLREKWGDYLEPIQESFEKENREFDVVREAVTASVLDNFEREFEHLDEATKANKIGSFGNHGYEILAASTPNLLAHETVSVQPMTEEVGQIFYMDFLYGSNKGSISKGDDMFSSTNAPQTNTEYTSEVVEDESLGDGDGTTKKFTGQLAYVPALKSVLTIKSTTGASVDLVVTDDGEGNLVGDVDGAGNNTIDYETGEYDVTFSTAPGNDVAILGTYEWDSELGNNLIPEMDVRVTKKAVEARKRRMKTVYTIDSALRMEKTYGKDISAELLAAASAEIGYEIDTGVFMRLLKGAKGGTVTFDKTVPNNISQQDHYATAVTTIIEGSEMIRSKTGRFGGNFILCGQDMSNILLTLGGTRLRKNPNLGNASGPAFVGVLDEQWRVYRVPAYPADEFLIGHKGPNFVQSGFVLSPYIMALTTPPITLANFETQRGYMSWVGQSFINGNMYVKGKVIAS